MITARRMAHRESLREGDDVGGLMANSKYALYRNAPIYIDKCPKCNDQFIPFLRGTVYSFWRRLLGMKCMCLICENCKKIVGHE